MTRSATMAAIAGPALGVGEKVLVTADAVHRKITGTVWFTSRRTLWRASDGKAAIQRVDVPWASIKSFQCSPAKEPRAMIRLLRVAEGDPPVVFRFLGSQSDTPREVLERAQTAIRKAMKGDLETVNSPETSAGSGIKAAGSKGGKSEGPAKKMKWASRNGLLATASGGQPLRLRDSMPGGRMRDMHDARQRAALLAGDEVLREQYKEMVQGNVLSEEEFWESRRRTLVEEDAKSASRHTGTPSDMPSDLVAETTSTGTLKFKLNARTIHGIFTMYPIVFKAYQANVPTEMTEKEFWTKYVQSAYFNRDRGSDGSLMSGNKRKGASAGAGVDDMFLRFAAQEAEREQKEKEQRGRAGFADGRREGGGESGGRKRLEAGTVDPLVDLTSQWGDYHTREVDDADPAEEMTEAANRRKEVVGKFNRHARLVMQPPDGGSGSGRRPALVDTAALATDIPELRQQDKAKEEKLHIANKNRYHKSGASSVRSRPHTPSVKAVEEVTLSEAKAELGPDFSILAGRPSLLRAVATPSQALLALRKCTEETNKGLGNAVNLQGYPEDFIGTMHRHFQIVGELLRHFYATLDRPKTDASATLKLQRLEERMTDKYNELNEERKQLPRNSTGNRLSAVIKPMMDCLNHAFQKSEERKRKGPGGGQKAGANTGGWVVAEDDDDEEEEEEDEEDDEEREMRGGWSVVR